MPTDLPPRRGSIRIVKSGHVPEGAAVPILGQPIRPRPDALKHFTDQLRRVGAIDPKTGLVRQPPSDE